MFNAGYYTDILLHEVKGKKYNKKWLFIKHWLKLTLLTIIILLIFIYET